MPVESVGPECYLEDGKLVKFVDAPEPGDVDWSEDEEGKLLDPRAELFEVKLSVEQARNPEANEDINNVEPVFEEQKLSTKSIAKLVAAGYDPDKHAEVFEPVKILKGYKTRKPKSQSKAKAVPADKDPDKIIAAAKEKEAEETRQILEDLDIKAEPYPVFPIDVMRGTSIYEGFVRPICEVNPCRIPEFMFMPAVLLYLNYLGTKVQVAMKDLSFSFDLVLIGRRGQTKKSSSVKEAMRFFETMGCLGHGEQTVSNANGRTLVFTAGSPEGFCIEMNRTNCKNGILFYDELVQLTNKAGIDGSVLTSALLSLYEASKLQNNVTNPKKSYSLLPGAYCASVITCSTDKNFEVNWSRLSGDSSGLNDRFMFLLQPEKLSEPNPFISVDTTAATVKTRQLIDRALDKKVYAIDDSSLLVKFMKEHKDQDRAEIRAEKLALYFAIDLGKESIDADCLQRAIAIVEYELKAKKFLPQFEAYNKQAVLQQRMMYELNRKGGLEIVRKFENNLNKIRYGTHEWDHAYNGLIKSGWMREQGAGTKGDPKSLLQLKPIPKDEEED